MSFRLLTRVAAVTAAAAACATTLVPMASALPVGIKGSPFEGLVTPNYPIFGITTTDLYARGLEDSATYSSRLPGETLSFSEQNFGFFNVQTDKFQTNNNPGSLSESDFTV